MSTLACSAPAGYVSDSTDCNDGNPALPRYFYRDKDGDGYAASFTAGPIEPPRFECIQPAGYATTTGDCDDERRDVHPGAAEVCGDGIDNNCSGGADESTICPLITCSAYSSSPLVPGGGTATFGFTTSGPVPTGSRAYLYGTRDYVMDTNGTESYDQTTFSFLVLNSPGLQGDYRRWVVIRGPDNTDLCTTNSVSAWFLAP